MIQERVVICQNWLQFRKSLSGFAILERASGLEPSSKTTAPRYSKLVTAPSFCPFTLISLWMPLALNKIPYAIRTSPSLTIFKRAVKHFLIKIFEIFLMEHPSRTQMITNRIINLRDRSVGLQVRNEAVSLSHAHCLLSVF